MRIRIRHIVAAILLLVLTGRSERAQAQDIDHKAYTLFLYNFMKYIEWPNTEGDFVVGVVGNSPIVTELMKLAESKKAKGRKILVKTLSSPDDMYGCSMVYITSSKSSLLKAFIEKSKGKSILIVGEREGLARKGAAISFVIEDDESLKFDLNKSVMDSHSLKVTNLLMQLATVID